MRQVAGVLLALTLVTFVSAGTIHVDANQHLSEVDMPFVGFTCDWYVSEDVNYGKKFGNAGILTVDLNNPLLITLVKALSPASWRIGGSPEDTVIYEVGDPPECPRAQQGPFPKPMCLSMQRWEEIINFATKTGVEVLFGLNGLNGRASPHSRMNTTNAREFLRYTAEKGFKVKAFELSNELGNDYQVYPQPLALDYSVIRSYINEFWPDDSNRPLFVGPDDEPGKFLSEFLPLASQYINATTYHTYAIYSGNPEIVEHLLNASYLDKQNDVDREAVKIAKTASPDLAVWGGEIGPAYDGGAADVTNRFVDSFWYLDKLGELSRLGIRRFLRSTLIGGDYEMVNRTTFMPNPDYYAALLWKRTTSTRSLAAHNIGFQEDSFRSYAMCASGGIGGVTVILLNLNQHSSVSADLEVIGGYEVGVVGTPLQKEYHVRSAGDVHSEFVELKNSDGTWTKLEIADGKLPAITPISVPVGTAVHLEPLSYAFVVFPDAAAPGCANSYQYLGPPHGPKYLGKRIPKPADGYLM
eukprot:TRINITY_DN2403_c0_g1_i1.p1 TRINITY_DN2403_c0_g1~~TRINITY_DN2403_c0_g1_i1.p1  ORF type:complete len:526 (-),score=100.92 TRINITY_DN2403_c0_g1_i1:37-1614(-)